MTSAAEQRTLNRALDLVTLGWCHDEQARTNVWRPCAPFDPAARYWSLDGALELAYLEARMSAAVEGEAFVQVAGLIKLVDLIEAECGAELAYWNDAPGRTQTEVVDLLAGLLTPVAS